jgi:hypothetical protein
MSTPVWAATYYADNGGAGAGTAGDPWSITQVNAQDFAASDVVLLCLGQTYTTSLTLASTSTAGALTVRAWATGDGAWAGCDVGADPHFDGDSIQPINITGTITTLTLKSINASNATRTGDTGTNATVASSVTNVTLDDITVDNSSAKPTVKHNGISVSVDGSNATGNIEIKNSTVKWTSFANPDDCSDPNDSQGILVWASYGTSKTGGSVLIHDNTIESACGDTILLSGIESEVNAQVYNNAVKGWAENAIDMKECEDVRIYNNTFDADDGFGSNTGPTIMWHRDSNQWPTATTSHDVYNNYFLDSPDKCIYAASGGDHKIYNNYFKNCRTGIWLTGTAFSGSGTGVEINNNVFEQTAAYADGDSAYYHSGILLGWPAESYAINGFDVHHNTFLGASTTNTYGIYYQGDNLVTGTLNINDNVFDLDRNSATVYPLYAVDGDGSWPTVDYNTFYNASHTNRVYWDDTFDNTEEAGYRTASSSTNGLLNTDPDLDTLGKLKAAVNNGSETVNIFLDPDSTFTPSISVVTMEDNERGSWGWQDAPPGAGGDTGLYNVLGGGTVGLGGSNITLSGE